MTAGLKWEWQQDLSVSHAKDETHLHTLPIGFHSTPPPPPPPLPHQPRVGTDVWATDAATLEPLLDPQGSTQAGRQLEELLAKRSTHTGRHIICRRLCEGVGGATAKCRTCYQAGWHDGTCFTTAEIRTNVLIWFIYKQSQIIFGKHRNNWRLPHVLSLRTLVNSNSGPFIEY